MADYPSVLIGYSGGVDSALLAVVARRTLGRDRVLAALGVSESLPAAQRQQAGAIARRFDVPVLEVPTFELDDPNYAANPTNRCYFCKSELWRRLAAVARERAIAVIADGTNADDLGEHRPGAQAATEFAVRSPLAEAGYTKAEVRSEAKTLNIPIWDAPAAPCLSSRVLYGIAVTPERLAQVEAAEALLREVGVTGDLRVRHRGAEARIEVSLTELPKVRAESDRVSAQLLELGFDRVTLDLGGYRRGSFLGEAAPLELLASRA